MWLLRGERREEEEEREKTVSENVFVCLRSRRAELEPETAR